jgi:hypothetical protein
VLILGLFTLVGCSADALEFHNDSPNTVTVSLGNRSPVGGDSTSFLLKPGEHSSITTGGGSSPKWSGLLVVALADGTVRCRKTLTADQRVFRTIVTVSATGCSFERANHDGFRGTAPAAASG